MTAAQLPQGRRQFALTTPSAKTEVDMSSHFHSGETVRLVRSSLRFAADGDFKIVRSLPDDGGETQYRIKSVREPHERVVKESDLRKG
jgi:hypothetical protein